MISDSNKNDLPSNILINEIPVLILHEERGTFFELHMRSVAIQNSEEFGKALFFCNFCLETNNSRTDSPTDHVSFLYSV